MIISSLIVFPKEEKKTQLNIELIEKKNESDDENKDLKNNNIDISNENQEKKDLKTNNIDSSNDNLEKKDFKKMIIVALKSKTMILNIIIALCYSQGPTLIYSLYRMIGEYVSINQNILQILSSTTYAFECLNGIIVGVLCDHIRLNILLSIITLFTACIVLTYCFSFSNSIAFFFTTNIATFACGSIEPFYDVYMLRVFGSDIYIELMGISSCIINTVILGLSPLSYYIETSVEEKVRAFWILMLSCGILNLIAVILTFFISIKPFDFGEKKNNRQKSRITNEKKT